MTVHRSRLVLKLLCGRFRLLATQEIEDRAYIRPKPSKEELAQEAYRDMQRSSLRTRQSLADTRPDFLQSIPDS